MITLEGIIGRNIVNKGDWKMFSFLPLDKYKDKVVLDERYGTIVISGILPDLIPKTQYKIDVEYSKKGQYHNYSVTRIHMPDIPITVESSFVFLKEVTSENRANELLSKYPDIIDRIINDKPISTKGLSNIGDKTLLGIKRKVKEHYQLIALVDEYSDYGMTFAMIKKLYNEYKTIDVIKVKMKEEPYECLCKLNGVGFKTADSFIMAKYPEMIDSKMRAKAAINFLLNQNETNGNTWIKLKSLYNGFLELAYEARTHFQDIIEKSTDIYFEADTNKVSTSNARLCESEIALLLSMHLEHNVVLDIDYSSYRYVGDGIELTDEQMGIFRNICKYNVSILAGVGGAGKSFSIQALLNMLKDNSISYKLFSSTGRAAKVLSEYVKEETFTIHRGLNFSPQESFEYNYKKKLDVDVLIVDEFSMIDIYLLRNLLRAVEPSRTKILFIGDPAQIPSVGTGNISFDMLESNRIPTTLLTKVFRYGEGGLSYVATKIRLGENYIKDTDFLQTFGVKKDYVFVNTVQEDSHKCLKTLHNNLLSKGVNINDIMVLTSYNKGEYGTVKINKLIQEQVNPVGKYITVNRFGESLTFRVGDRVMQIKNNYDKNSASHIGKQVAVFNGDIGTIASVKEDEILVNIDGNLIQYKKEELNELDLAYCITIHKSQGGAFNNVILITPKAHKFFLNRNLLYVAVSRAKQSMFHIGSIDVIKSALRKSANLSRDTFLKEFLENKISKNLI